jgi:hypothetical protein
MADVRPPSSQFDAIFGKKVTFGRWEPKYEFARPKEVADQQVFSVEEDEDLDGWVRPPESSHLEQFTIFDYPKRLPFSRIKKQPSHRVIAVVFEQKGRWPRTEYWYYFTDFTAANAAFELMSEAESPGEVIWSVMIRDNISYRKVA